jgi:hypothetical protein
MMKMIFGVFDDEGAESPYLSALLMQTCSSAARLLLGWAPPAEPPQLGFPERLFAMACTTANAASR